MSHYSAEVEWQRHAAPFLGGSYSRGHHWRFDGGIEVPASASPQIVPLPHSLTQAVDPEEAFIASLSSCHMLWFLDIACRRGWLVEHYRDQATGILARNTEGQLAMTQVTLHPQVRFGGAQQPGMDVVTAMHAQAHADCFIARSVRTEVCCEPIACDPAPTP